MVFFSIVFRFIVIVLTSIKQKKNCEGRLLFQDLYFLLALAPVVALF